MSRVLSRCVLFAALSFFLMAGQTRADNFFNVEAVGSGGTVVSSSGPNIIHLSDNLISLDGPFFALTGQNMTASMTWGGVPNAIRFTENSGGTTATLSFPTTGFTTTFVGSDPDDLQNQIHNFIKGNGEQAYARFLQSMNQLSSVAPLDGNPQSSTALIADDVFTHFGMENQQPTVSTGLSDGAYIGISGNGGEARTAGLNGTWADFALDTGVRFGSNIALNFGTTLAYRDTEGSEAYTAAEEVALPVTFIVNHGDGLSWQVTPWGFAGLAWSEDEAAGGILVGGGGTSSLALHLGGLTLTLGDQISYTGNVSVNYAGYAFDTVIDQWILKDGLDAAYQFPGTPFFVEAGIAYSNFLHQAAIPDYWTPTIGGGLAFGQYSSLKVSYQGDFARKYNQNGGIISLVIVY